MESGIFQATIPRKWLTKSNVVSYNKEWYSSQCVPNYSVILIATPKTTGAGKRFLLDRMS